MLNFLETQNYFIKYNKNTSVVKKKKRKNLGNITKLLNAHVWYCIGNKDSDGRTYTT